MSKKQSEVVLYCPDCGYPGMVRNAKAGSGNQRWLCKECGMRTTRPLLQPPQDSDDESKTLDTIPYYNELSDYIEKHPKARFVITAAQNATPLFRPVFNTLLSICRKTNAKLIVIPYRYHNPTNIWSQTAQDNDWWDSELTPYLLDQKLLLNNNLMLLADIMTQPTAVNPTSGFETITGSMSAVLGHPKLEWVTIPTPHKKMAKIITTTGTVTKSNYIPSKAGKKAEHHHCYGALMVETDGDKFFPRQLIATNEGKICDLDTEYSPNGKTRKIQALGLVMGDTHEEFVDPNVVAATFENEDSMMKVLKPKYTVYHDTHDFYSRNHHHKDEVFINYAKYVYGLGNVEKALDQTFDFVDKHTPIFTKNVFVPSNHPDALARWVKETNPKADPENMVFWAQTFQAMAENTKMTPGGARTIDPFYYWASQKLKCFKRSIFLSRDQSFRLQGVEIGYHGDQGPNGTRGNIRGFGKIGTRSIIGHSHTPGIKDGVYQVGTSSYLSLEYNKGPSSWLHCHAVIYPNGKRSLLMIIDDQWRVK